jgi:hypothetical protein
MTKRDSPSPRRSRLKSRHKSLGEQLGIRPNSTLTIRKQEEIRKFPRRTKGAAITDGGGSPPLSALAGAATTGDSRPEVDYTPLGVRTVLEQ